MFISVIDIAVEISNYLSLRIARCNLLNHSYAPRLLACTHVFPICSCDACVLAERFGDIWITARIRPTSPEAPSFRKNPRRRNRARTWSLTYRNWVYMISFSRFLPIFRTVALGRFYENQLRLYHTPFKACVVFKGTPVRAYLTLRQ
eukprot:2226404-Pleurochrysis_carterae.AAC.1